MDTNTNIIATLTQIYGSILSHLLRTVRLVAPSNIIDISVPRAGRGCCAQLRITSSSTWEPHRHTHAHTCDSAAAPFGRTHDWWLHTKTCSHRRRNKQTKKEEMRTLLSHWEIRLNNALAISSTKYKNVNEHNFTHTNTLTHFLNESHAPNCGIALEGRLFTENRLQFHGFLEIISETFIQAFVIG